MSETSTIVPMDVLNLLFKHYTSFGDRTNNSYIQGNKVQKLMKDWNVIGKTVTKTDVDMVFTKVNKSKPNMYYKDFLEVLNQIASLKYKGSQAEAFKELFYQNIYPKCEELGLVSKDESFNIEFDSIVSELFLSKINLLYDIYHSYFTLKVEKSTKISDKEMQACEKALFEFLRDFEVCPKLLSKSKVCNIWAYIIDDSKSKKTTAIYSKETKSLKKSYDITEENKLFTFAYFLDFLALMGHVHFINESKKKRLESEAVILLFEHMNVSTGFANFESKMCRTQSDASSLKPTDEVKQMVRDLRGDDEADVEMEETKTSVSDFLSEKIDTSEVKKEEKKSSRKSSTSGTAATKPKTVKKETKAVKTSSSSSIPAITEYSEDIQALIPQLKTIYGYYCAFGEPDNHTKLKSSMFQKMLKDAKIIK